MGHHIDDKTAPGKTHSLPDGRDRKQFLVAVLSSRNQTETQVWALKGPGQCSDSDRSSLAWQLVSHTLGCTLSFHRQSECDPLMWPTHTASTLSFREDRRLQVEIGAERPRKEPNAQTLARSPAQHFHFDESNLGTLPGISFTG